jgi:hypothetical protein
VYVVAAELLLTSTAKVRSDVNSVAEELVIEGSVGRDLYASGGRLDLRGSVGRHIRSHWLDELDLRDGSYVGGDVEVRLAEGREIARAPGARVQGEVRTSVAPNRHEHYLDHYRSWRFYAVHLLWFAAAFVFGLLVYWIAPAAFRGAISTGGELFRTLGRGFVVLVVGPVAIVAVALTVVGIPVALLGLFAYIAALYTADLAVGAWLGRWLAPPADDSMFAFGRSLALGLAIVTAVTLVPFLGPPAGVVAMLIGLGMLSARVREALD